jgi:hypothetical protein
MTELRPDSRSLFQHARRDFAITDDERARLDAALAARLALAAGATTTLAAAKGATVSVPPAAAGGGAAASTATSMLAMKIVGALAIVGAVSGGVTIYASRRPAEAQTVAPRSSVGVSVPSTIAETSSARVVEALAPPPTTSDAPTPTASVAPSPARRAPAVVAPAGSTSPAHRAPAAVAPAAAPARSSAGSVAAETQLLREADAALRGGDAARALGLLDEHARAYPNGALREEESAERVFALCKLGRVPEARGEADRFLRANGDSPLAASVRASCGGRASAP